VTKIGLERGDMKPENAAALVAAGMLSVLIFPGDRVRHPAARGATGCRARGATWLRIV
jgi:hypothetical protein